TEPRCPEAWLSALATSPFHRSKKHETVEWVGLRISLPRDETYRIVTFNKSEPPDHGASPHFINRVTFHPENLSLKIDPVNKSDSGLYSLIIDIGGGSLLSERVRQPNLTVLSAHAELGQCNVTLSCSVPGADRVTYSWSRGTSQIPSDRDHQLPGHQSLLHVAINANSSDVFYRCNASNRASWDADTVAVKSLCDSPCRSCSRRQVIWARGVRAPGIFKAGGCAPPISGAVFLPWPHLEWAPAPASTPPQPRSVPAPPPSSVAGVGAAAPLCAHFPKAAPFQFPGSQHWAPDSESGAGFCVWPPAGSGLRTAPPPHP
uniref:Ig-like domain-containing protein n=1 Tax=Terrapene triunguis TaxID=2587831 RepID=A0A674JXE7_9SAUR